MSLTKTEDRFSWNRLARVPTGVLFAFLVSAGVLAAGGCGTQSKEAGSPVQPAAIPPSTPAGVTAAAGLGEVTVYWIASPGATAYVVLRATNARGPYVPVGVTPAPSTSFVDAGLPASTTFYYAVQALSGAGTSVGSPGVAATTLPPPPVAPSAPAGIVAQVVGAQVQVGWYDAPGATGYVVLRSTASGGPYTPIGTSTFTGFTDSSVVGGTLYYYVVEAGNEAGVSPASSEVQALTIPDPPTGLAVVSTSGGAALTWAASTGAASYLVLRGTTPGGPYGAVGSPRTASFTDTGLQPGTTYYYVVQAVDATGSSGNSSEVSLLVGPAAPTGLVAAGRAGQITVTWSAASGATSYLVFRSAASGGPYAQVGAILGTLFADTGLGAGATYFYVVVSVNAAGSSPNSGQVGATTLPAPPTGLAAVPGVGQVSLSWIASTGATGYAVSRGPVGGPYARVAVVGGTSFTDTLLAAGTTYGYVVQAGNGAGTSATSAAVTALTAPAAPTNLTAAGGVGQIALAWSAPTSATGYLVLRWNGASYAPLGSTSAASFTDTGLADNTTHYYEVEASNGALSPASATGSATTSSPAPGGLTAVGGIGQVALSWNASTGATAYAVYRWSGVSYVFLATSAATAYTDTGLSDNSPYSYEVQSWNGGAGPMAGPVTATTAPGAPGGLTAIGGVGQVALSWSAPTGATGYVVLRWNGASYAAITSVGGTNFTDSTLSDNTTYFYEVEASNGVLSPTSATASATTAPSAPSGVTATGGVQQVALSWNASAGATGYLVLRWNGAAFASVGSVSGTAFTDMGLADSTTYYYEVEASNGALSPPSATASAGTSAPAPGGLTAVGGIGQVALSWNVSTGATGYAVYRWSGVSYAFLATSAGTAFTDTGLSDNSPYSYEVQPWDGGAGPMAGPVTATTAPGAPGGLTAVGGVGRADLSWSAPTGATGYVVLRWNGASFVSIGSAAGTGFADTGLSDNTIHIYEVEASNGALSAASATASATTAPGAPTGLTATGGVGQADLSWSAPTGATGYVVLRWSGAAFAPLASTTAASLTDTGLSDDTTYFYEVEASNGALSPPSATASATTAPGGPTNVIALGGVGEAVVSWSASAGATGYVVLRWNGAAFIPVAATSGLGFTDLVLSDNTSYTYEIQASNGALSLPSGSATALTAPSAPTNLTAMAGVGKVDLSWTASAGATGYAVLSWNGSAFVEIATTVGTTYSDVGLGDATTRFYEVEASNGAMSPPSATASATTAPAAPTGVSALGEIGQVALSWNASTGATGYAVLRWNGAAFVTVASTGTVTYTDSGLSDDTSYFYAIEASNGVVSPASATASATTAPAAPTGLSTLGGIGQVALSWNASTGATGYAVLRWNGAAYVTIASAGTTSYDDLSLADNTTYSYEVEASNGASSPPSATASATTAPSAPSGFTAVGGTGTVSLSWGAPAGATGYAVLRWNGSGYDVVTSTASTSYTDAGLLDGTDYTYEVEASNGALGNPAGPVTSRTLSAAPFGLTATGGTGRVDLSWAASTGATGYAVGMGSMSGGPYAPAGTSAGSAASVLRLVGGTTEFFVVTAWNASGPGGTSIEASATPATREVCVANFASNLVAVLDGNLGGDQTPLRTFGDLVGLRAPVAVTVDAVNGEILVLDAPGSGPNSIRVYALSVSGNVAPLRVLAGPSTGLDAPQGIAVDPANDRILVTEGAPTNAVAIYPRTVSGNAAPTQTIQGPSLTALSSPSGIDVDPLDGEIFVANGSAGTGYITVFAWSAVGDVAPLRVVSGSTGLVAPSALAYDAVNDEIVVADASAASVSAFPRTATPDAAPSRVLAGPSTGLGAPMGVAVDSIDDLLFVGNFASGSITVYARSAAGDTAPLQTITGPPAGMAAVGGVALDLPDGNVLGANGAGVGRGILAFPTASAGTVIPVGGVSARFSGVFAPEGIAVDATNDEIFVADRDVPAVAVFPRTASGGGALARITVGDQTLLSQPMGVALDVGTGRMFVPNAASASIAVYDRSASGNATPVTNPIMGPSTGLVAPRAVTVDAVNGEIWVADPGTSSLVVFLEGDSGDVAPRRTLAGADLAQPTALAVDPARDEVYAADATNDSVVVYSRTASGASVASLRVISGSNTGISNPRGIAIDSGQDEILVANSGGDSIAVFPRSASGNVAPSRTLAGPSTGLDAPTGLAACTP